MKLIEVYLKNRQEAKIYLESTRIVWFFQGENETQTTVVIDDKTSFLVDLKIEDFIKQLYGTSITRIPSK